MTDSDRANRTIVVVGASGQQGGAVARRLRRDGWRVQALTRDPAKPAAQALSAAGIELVQGDLTDQESVTAALAGAYGLFSVQTWYGTESGIAEQTRLGLALADAARTAGVQHIVHSSVDGAERASGIPHFDNQWPVEQHIRVLDLPATILRPVFFMENFNLFFSQSVTHGVISLDLRPETRLQMIAVDDIGALAALAFADPTNWIGRTLAIAGDELTMPQTAEILSQELGYPIQYVDNPQIFAGDDFLSREFRMMFAWYNQHGYQADIAAVRRLHPRLMTLAAWLKATGWGAPAPM